MPQDPQAIPTQAPAARPGHPASEDRRGRPALAILPFQDLSPERSESHLCEGLADEVLLALNRIEALRVLSRTSSFLYQDANLPLEEVGRRLGAGLVLTGSLSRAGDRLGLHAALVQARDGTVLWEEDLASRAPDPFALVEAVAAGVARALGLAPPALRHGTRDLEAYEDYLRGRQAYFRYTRHALRFALQCFQQALDRDPRYAAAWAGVANCEAYLYIYVDRAAAHRDRAEAASLRALELDPCLAEAHASRGAALSAAGRGAEAVEAFETALRLDPNLYEAAYFYARHCFAAGRMEEAIQFFEWAAALRPEDFQATLLVAQAWDALGVADEAAQARRRGLALVEERLRHAPDDVRARYLGANALVALGEREKGLAWARLARDLDPEDSMLLYNLGCIHALAGEGEEALECLEMAARAGLTQRAWYLHDGDLDGIRALPRFQALLSALEEASPA